MLTRDTIIKTILLNHLPSFIYKSFTFLHGQEKYEHNWHIDLIADYLSRIKNNDINRLIINVPPRYLKSIVSTVCWPAWLLANDPTCKIIISCYNQALSEKHLFDCKLIIKSPWYQKLFPDVKLAKDTNKKIQTSKNGHIIATSVNGSILGEGADILILDDPHNPKYIHNEKQRKYTLEWFTKVFLTRLNNKIHGGVVVISQRLHSQDISSQLKKNHQWKILSIPAIFNKPQTFKINDTCITKKTNEVIHANREDLKTLKKIALEIGEHSFLAQYQQQPIKQTSLLKKSFIKRYKTIPQQESLIFHSWDTAESNNINSNYSVCTVWKITNKSIYLVNVIKVQLQFYELKQLILDTINQDNPHNIIIEAKSSGKSLISEISKNTSIPIHAIIPKHDKVTRFTQVLHFFFSGKVILPSSPTPWIEEYETEITLFPYSKNNDQVDSTSQFLIWYQEQEEFLKDYETTISPTIRSI